MDRILLVVAIIAALVAIALAVRARRVMGRSMPASAAGDGAGAPEQDDGVLQPAFGSFAAGSDGIVISDARDRIVSANDAILAMLGFERAELLGKDLGDVLAPGDTAHARDTALREAGSWNGELTWRCRGGETRRFEGSEVSLRDASGAIVFRVHVCVGAAELKYAQARIRHLAYFDTLTGLPNRTYLRGAFADALGSARETGQPLAVVFVDLDNFKEINDTAGHSVGDELICAVAQRLGQLLREEDVLCRFGGDEFLVLLPDTAAAAAEALTAQWLEDLRKPVEVEGRMLDVAASAGFSMFPEDAQDAENLVRQADTALFRAKEDGGNSVQRFQAWMGEAVSWRHDMQAALRVAIVRSQFTMRYQPIVDARGRRVAGVEALLYWDRPGMGVVGPATFINLAEESRLIEPIGEWVVHDVCRQVAEWKRAGIPRFYVAVNVSGLQLRIAGRFQQHLDHAMREHGVVNDDLVLEITERHLVQDIRGGLPVLESLAASGIRVAVDDFGTGYSNLESLKNLTVSQIKVDRTFVRNLMTEVGDRAIVGSIIALGRSLGLRVVAEGVESVEQQRLLQEFGCDLQQGYLYARPLRADEVPPFVAAFAADGTDVRVGS